MDALLRGSALRLALLAALFSAACTGLPVVGGVVADAPDATDVTLDLGDTTDLGDDTLDAADAPDVSDGSDAPDVSDDAAPDGPSRCVADADCAATPATPVCDAPSGRCVACAAGRDACPDGRYCDTASQTCLAGCRDDDACARAAGDAGVDASAVPLASRCNPATRACVECVVDAHCPAGLLCVGNTCVMGCTAARPCPGTQTCCAGACVDPVSNVAHCGRCDNRCAAPNASAACMNGSCAVGACTAPFADCDRDPANGCEANTLSDVAHCGACGAACPALPHAASVCAAGRCAFTCDAGFADCDRNPSNGCEVDLGTTEAHCGACGTVCNPPNAVPSCVAGRCAIAACAAGFGDCDGNPSNGCEADTNTAVSHCGRCGNACPARPSAFPGCLGGACVTSCVMGFQDCDGVDANGCEADVRVDPANCGSCGRACAPAHATGACASARCAITRCDDGYADCDADPANGCEVNVRSDASNCSACGARCVTPGATPACMSGRCDIAACATGRADCDLNAATGCEVDLAGDVRNCGACGTACSLPNATAACSAGRCAVATCNAGFADCNGDAADGCETNLATSAAHCGRCNNACSFPGSSAACDRGACRIASCAVGRGDCDGDSGNGCETTFATDVRNCGACGMGCAAANGTALCAAGRCGVASCNAGFADCDGNPANGCEVNTRSDASNCSACGARCVTAGATPACVSGRCEVAACDVGRADCDGNPANGCEVTPATDARNCGACGTSCALPNAAAVCAAGRCAVGACNAGFANCNGNPVDGCEVLLASDASNCGACGTRCAPANGTGACASGACAVVACNPGFADCNGSPADGCEANLNADPTRCGACSTRCALANATAACTGARCTVAGCNAGYSDCNGNPADGCEVNTAGDPAACGACGRACALSNVASAGCAGGACTVGACVAGFGNCNGSAADGCEANLSTDPSNCRACGGRPAEACNLADDNCNAVCDDVDGCRTGVYRSLHGSSGEHFYTSSAAEAVCCGFRLEYANYYYLYSATAPGLAPFYRCIMDYGKHFYTTASNCETGLGRVEGVLGYIASSPVCGAIPLYRVYQVSSGDHFYTTSADERDSALRGGYINEGIAGYVWPTPRN
jgi:hypothetical protein